MKSSRHARLFDANRPLHVLGLLALVAVLSRLPFLHVSQLVAYDGTFYIGQARALFARELVGAFPFGYPVAIKIFSLFLPAGQAAAQLVSFLAAIASTFVVYLLIRIFAGGGLALLGAVALSLNPLFVRYSTVAMSESVYIFWILLALLLYARGRFAACGVASGAAMITRPEGILMVALLALSRIRRPRQFLVMVAAVFSFYVLNITVLSVKSGHVVWTPKSEAFHIGTEYWKSRESMGQFSGKEQLREEIAGEVTQSSRVANYAERLPQAARSLFRHTWPAFLALALLALRHREARFLFAGLAFFFFFPALTARGDDRFVLPFLPIVIVSAMVGVSMMADTARRIAIIAVSVTVVLLPVANRATLTVPEDPGMLGMKAAGLAIRDRVVPGDRVADRKPYAAFYAGARYFELPVAPYADTMTELDDARVRFVSMNAPLIHSLRPAMDPLLYDRAFIHGEIRYRQAYFDRAGNVIYERIRDTDPLRWTRLTTGDGVCTSPAWSPDGNTIAYRRAGNDGADRIEIIPVYGGDPARLVEYRGALEAISWSPDARRIAYAATDDTGRHVFTVEVATGAVRQLTHGKSMDAAPAWTPDGLAIVFASNRAGTSDIWRVLVSTHVAEQLTTVGDATHPSVSPDGSTLACTRKSGGVMLLDLATGNTNMLSSPTRVEQAASWSPDGRVLAVTASDWTSWDIYLQKTDGANALVLTKLYTSEVMPVWSPNGRRIAIVSGRDGMTRVWLLDGIEPYLQRLEETAAPGVFAPPGS